MVTEIDLPMTYEETALLAAIAASPADDLPRLVYADYLEDSPREDGRERADAIRRGVKKSKWFTFPEGEGASVGFTSTRLDLPSPCVITLARGYPGVTWQSYKGMIGACICTWETWLASGDNLLARNWIPEVVVSNLIGPRNFIQPYNARLFSTVNQISYHGRGTVLTGLGAEWTAVSRWILPEPIIGIRWTYPAIEPDEYDGHSEELQGSTPSVVDRYSCPQVGAVVKTIGGRSGTLITSVDAHGYGCVRSEYK